jgi:hypothetical protein
MKTVLVLSAVLALVGCNQKIDGGTENRVSSIQLTLVSPAPDALGSPLMPIQTMAATFNLQAVDDHGNDWTQDLDVQVFVSFGGVKTGGTSVCGTDATGNDPIATIHMAGGAAQNQTVMLPQAFGPTAIWLDDPVSHATGASPTMYFRNPYITEVQTPPDLTASNATFCSSFDGKYIVIDHATGSGQLVVSSVFQDAFAVTDTGATEFNSLYIYSFGQPPDDIVEGRLINDMSGNISKFVGFSELNFPLFDAADDKPLVSPPPPVIISQSSLANRDNVGLLKYGASVVVFTGNLCNPLPANPTMDPNIQSVIDQWNKYDTFVLDGDGTCSSLTNFAVQLPAKVFGGFDPLTKVGASVTVVGMLQNNSGQNPYLDANGNPITCSTQSPCAMGTCISNLCKKGSFNFWTVHPRTPADITVH